jgi:ketose-bisphosphate aldolase
VHKKIKCIILIIEKHLLFLQFIRFKYTGLTNKKYLRTEEEVKMPLTDIRPYLEDSRRKKYALGCFNVFDTETLEGVIEAAVNKNTPVVCAIYEPQFKYGDLESFTDLIKSVASKTDVPVILHLDHATELSSIVRAIKYGFTAVMFDGPVGASFEEKAEKTKKAVEIAHLAGVTIEAELGYITRVGVDEKASSENMADPKLAKEFIESTGIDILAPAIGSIHGMGEQKATLNLDLLSQIAASTDCYLSLHGGSGVDDYLVQKAIDLGINKASVYTRLSNMAIERIKESLSNGMGEISAILNEVRNGFREGVENRLEVLRSVNVCDPVSGNCHYCNSDKYCISKTSIPAFTEKQSYAKSSVIGSMSGRTYEDVMNNVSSLIADYIRNK